jgi:hypothetical protein
MMTKIWQSRWLGAGSAYDLTSIFYFSVPNEEDQNLPPLFLTELACFLNTSPNGTEYSIACKEKGAGGI